jgi:hypothetical protein
MNLVAWVEAIERVSRDLKSDDDVREPRKRPRRHEGAKTDPKKTKAAFPVPENLVKKTRDQRLSARDKRK